MWHSRSKSCKPFLIFAHARNVKFRAKFSLVSRKTHSAQKQLTFICYKAVKFTTVDMPINLTNGAIEVTLDFILKCMMCITRCFYIIARTKQFSNCSLTVWHSWFLDPRRAVPKPTRPLSILPTRPLFLPWVLTNPSPKSINSKSVISCCCVGIYFNNFQSMFNK